MSLASARRAPLRDIFVIPEPHESAVDEMKVVRSDPAKGGSSPKPSKGTSSQRVECEEQGTVVLVVSQAKISSPTKVFDLCVSADVLCILVLLLLKFLISSFSTFVVVYS